MAVAVVMVAPAPVAGAASRLGRAEVLDPAAVDAMKRTPFSSGAWGIVA